MAFFYSLSGDPVELTLSDSDIAVRLESPEIARSAVRAARASVAGLRETTPRSFGRVVLLPQVGDIPAEAAVRATLPSRASRAFQRRLPVYVEKTSGLRAIATREITVRFKPRASEAREEKLLRELGLVVLRGNPFHFRQYIVAQDESADRYQVVDLANRLRSADDLVEFAAPNFVSEHRKEAATNDELLPRQWHLDNSGANGAVAGEDVDAFLAWGVVPGGSSGVVIAIVDDGVDIRHPDLRRNIWKNPDSGALDVNGRNFYDDNFDPRPHYFQEPYDQMTGNDIHGTPCAGVAAAVGNNTRGVAGVAYGCRILPVKIFGADDLAPNDRVADSIRYSGMHAQVISCSWSGTPNTDLEAAINDVVDSGRNGKGCLVFCATGNGYSSQVGFPARHPKAFAIGASNDCGKRSAYSNYGTGIDFVAPSSDSGRQGITTTDVSLKNRGFSLNSAYTDSFGGTSSATPLAAGIAALVLSKNPDLTRNAVYSLFRNTADKIDSANGAYDANGYSLQYGYGRLNAHGAVQAA